MSSRVEMPIGRKPRESVGRKQKLFEREAEVKDRIQSWSEKQMKGIMTNLDVTKTRGDGRGAISSTKGKCFADPDSLLGR